MTYAICFDFPQLDEPLFAGWAGDGAPGLAPTLRTAIRFDTEAAAATFLNNSYGPNMGEFGAVVEVAGVAA